MLTGNLQIKKLSHYFLITILWCLCVGVLAFFSVDVSAQSAETVKVGYYFSNNFQEGMDDRSPKKRIQLRISSGSWHLIQAGNMSMFMANGMNCSRS